MSSLRTLILCGSSPRHVYVANRLCRASTPVAIVQERGMTWTSAKIRKALKPGTLGRKIGRWLRDRRRYAGGGEARFFFGDSQPTLHRADLLMEASNINDATVVELAEHLQPDVIAVFGTSLIRGPLLRMGRLGIFNLHGGLSPQYRGADCTFWALYNGEPEMVGCTLHRIDAGIDTGTLIAHVCPEVREGDGELTLFWRGVRDSAEAYAELLQRLELGECLGRKQQEKGTLYQVRQRGLRQERELERRVRAGLLDGVRLPRRIVWFMGDDVPNASARPPGMSGSCATLSSPS
jgi:folate-dependent phosphoribosylglycinamide formyltransferase PurN